jgi:hypothetical protein
MERMYPARLRPKTPSWYEPDRTPLLVLQTCRTAPLEASLRMIPPRRGLLMWSPPRRLCTTWRKLRTWSALFLPSGIGAPPPRRDSSTETMRGLARECRRRLPNIDQRRFHLWRPPSHRPAGGHTYVPRAGPQGPRRGQCF